ncbi:MAG: DUF3471 domain-containing protein, partial [Methylocystis sp.]|nr:DUF3471 domain-containing protein [Methylocystis sp.]
GYVGRYQWGPNINLTVTREDNRLFVQPTGEPKLEIFAESEKDYFLKVVDAQITFQTDGSGQATGLILHHNGRDTPATRIDERS